MNEEFSEQILDSLLEEILTDQHPPDLTKRIEAAWKLEKATRRPQRSGLVVAELVEDDTLGQDVPVTSETSARESISLTIGDNDATRPPRPVSPNTLRPEASQSDPRGLHRPVDQARSRRRTNLAAILAVSAAVLLMFLGWQTLFKPSQGNLALDDGSQWSSDDLGDPLNGSSDTLDVPLSIDGVIGDYVDSHQSTPVEGERKSDIPAGEVLDINDLPFGSKHLGSNYAGSRDTNHVDGPAPDDLTPAIAMVEKLDADVIVANLDRQLMVSWEQLGVQPQQKLSAPELARKIGQTLVGRELRGRLVTKHVSGDGQLDSQRLSKTLIDSNEFSRFWADNVTRQWLRRGSLPVDDPQVQTLAGLVSDRIASGGPWNEVVVQLLGGGIASQPGDGTGADRSTADVASTVFVTALAGGGNHRLVRRLGANFLNANLACARCHDANLGERSSEMQDQQTYWSLIALLYGVDAKGSGRDGTRIATDNQPNLFLRPKPPSVFYDLLDGRLQVAHMRLPGGTQWNSGSGDAPREYLARWIAESRLMDRATVNRTWKLIFGRHLVPQIDGMNVVAIPARDEMLDLLTSQFHAHDRDVKQLVHWIVSCDAFARDSSRMTRSEWLDATDDELEKLQVAELAFASGPSLGQSPESSSLERSLTAMIKWSSSNTGIGRADVLLAQPDIRAGIVDRKNRSQPTTVEMPEMSFAIHAQNHTSAERTFVKRLLHSARLSWGQRVEHVVALSEYDSANDRIQQLAKDLLQQNQGNAEAALLDLLWAVSNANAG